MVSDHFGTCPSGSWKDCPNVAQCTEAGWQVMRCSVSGLHPDLCHNYSRPTNTIQRLERVVEMERNDDAALRSR